LFSERREDLYVGRTNNLRRRLQMHCRPNATHLVAAFAFRLARHATGTTKASYAPAGSRAALLREPAFLKAFQVAKARIARMDVRFVGEDDPTCQCLLEIYAAVIFGTAFNDFDNH